MNTLIAILLVTVTVCSGELKTSCERTSLSIDCPDGQVLRIGSAFYGRTDKTTCPHKAIYTTQCDFQGADQKVKTACEGQNSCSFPATNDWFGNDPCPRTVKYAQVNYECKPANARKRSLEEVTSCERQELSLSCSAGQTIRIRSAFYGRTDRSTCPNKAIYTTECDLSGAGEKVKQECQGKASCTFPVTNSWFGGDPCQRTVKYATVKYVCRTPAKRIIACEHAAVNIECPAGHEVQIRRVLYGRRNKYTCPYDSDSQVTKCSLESAQSVVKGHCDGHQSCSFSATNGFFKGDPCQGTRKYARIVYRCKASK